MALLPGVSVYVAADLAGSWEPAERLAVNTGTVAESIAVPDAHRHRNRRHLPKPDWRPVSPGEAAVLCGRPADTVPRVAAGAGVFVYRIPDELRARFWRLDLDSLFVERGVRGPARSPEYEAFLSDVVAFLRGRYCTVDGAPSAHVVATAPGNPSTTFDTDLKAYIGLHFDNFDRSPLPERAGAPRRLGINLGDEERYLLFVNQTAAQMYDRLALAHTPENHEKYRSVILLACQFLGAFPDYPVVRLGLRPGEGYLAPTQNMLHDGYAVGKAEPDVNLLIRAAHFSPYAGA
jgi:hypothetical protein